MATGWMWDFRIPAEGNDSKICPKWHVTLRWNPTGLHNSGLFSISGDGRYEDFQTGPLCCHLYFLKQPLFLKINNIISLIFTHSVRNKATSSCPSPAPQQTQANLQLLMVSRWLGCPLGAFSRCESLCLHLLLVFQEVSPFGKILHLQGRMKRSKKLLKADNLVAA